VEKLSNVLMAEMNATLQIARKGDYATALERAEATLAENTDNGAVEAFVGMLYCQAGDLGNGITHLKAALRVNPDDVIAARNLVTALMDSGDVQAALVECTEERALADPSLRMGRLRGYLLEEADEHVAAAKAYSLVVAAAPSDFESWNNMGNALTNAGDVDGSITALQRAVALRPDLAPTQLNLATAMINAGQPDRAIEVLEACAAKFPNDANPLIELGGVFQLLGRNTEALALFEKALPLSPDDASLHVRIGDELMLIWSTERAEAEFRTALALDPLHTEGHIQLAIYLEQLNKINELEALLESAASKNVTDGAVQFIRALVCRRQQKFAEGLDALSRIPSDIQPVKTAQLEGEFADRLNDTNRAFAAFTRVNDTLLLDASEPAKRSEAHRAAIRGERDIVTEQWFSSWRQSDAVDHRPSPVFIVGFPRSGTTLLDTMLMGHPRVEVLEEKPPIRVVEDLAGGIEKLAMLSDDEIGNLRDRYYSEAARYVDLKAGSVLVDKFPMHLTKVPVMHRLFPDAKFILALRHPYDVVLSCFITSFRLNNAMTNFLDLKTAAETYDLVFNYWEQCISVIPTNVHVFRYESMIVDREAELRSLFKYLELDWDGSALDHTRTAVDRGVISTASYSQVTEPIYSRATGRWERYREHMTGVLPILAPWAERFGYEA
jgi:tetratricopeptide (TPR) repeat protein